MTKMVSLSFFLILLSAISLCLAADGPHLSLAFPHTDASLFSLLHIRLPRTLLALLAGGSYAVSGLVLQTYVRTPLADANLIGVGSFAALGSLLGLYLGLTSSFQLILLSTLFSIALPMGYLFFLRNSLSPSSLILIGLCITTFTQGLISLLIYIIHQDFPLNEVLFWLFGSFSHHTLSDIFLILPFIASGFASIYLTRKPLDFLCLSPEMMHSAGICQRKLGLRLILSLACLVGPVISITGIIGFIGIIAPHLTHRVWQKPPSQLLLPTTLIGSTLTLLADLLVRLLPLGYELNVGILVSIIASPVFIYLIVRQGAHA